MVQQEAHLVALVEGMALKRPLPSAAVIHRRVRAVAEAQDWRVRSHGTVHAIIVALDPGMVTAMPTLGDDRLFAPDMAPDIAAGTRLVADGGLPT